MLLSKSSFLLPLVQFLSFSSAAEQKILKNRKASPLNSKFEKLVYENLDLWKVPGVAVGVVDGELEWSEGYGIATYPDTKVTPSTLYYTGSTTKAFTAAAMSLLVDDNANYSNVQWNTPIVQLIPDDFMLSDEWATNHITIEDALSHRTGLPRHDYSYGGNYEGNKPSVKAAVRAIRHLPLTAEPRTKFQYCNVMYSVASHVIQTLTGKWLGDVLKERIWEPLEMKATFFSASDAENAPEHLAQGYVYYKEKYQPVEEMDLSCVSGAGSIVSNIHDYSKWLKSLLSMSGPISKAGHKALRTPHIFEDRDDEPTAFTGPKAYALGWSTGVYHGYEFFEHGGGMIAYGTDIIFFPALNYGLVAFGNTAVTSNFLEQALLWHLIDEHLNIPEQERFDWNKKNKERLQEFNEEYENTWKKVYPHLPDPPLPTILPLQNYTGTYFHPAYNNITLEIKNGTLYANRLDATLKLEFNLDHISGDYFIAYADSTEAPGTAFRAAVPAEFKVSADGISKAFGLAAEPEMGPNGRIWFERI
ncbi:putative penicillin-binding protein [Stipitochalara longipes BDJ]|nr:putative penicillin-binding protein [Stipitochalara longipes BDJ]